MSYKKVQKACSEVTRAQNFMILLKFLDFLIFLQSVYLRGLPFYPCPFLTFLFFVKNNISLKAAKKYVKNMNKNMKKSREKTEITNIFLKNSARLLL